MYIGDVFINVNRIYTRLEVKLQWRFYLNLLCYLSFYSKRTYYNIESICSFKIGLG